MFEAKQILLLLPSFAICAPGQVQVDDIHNLAFPNRSWSGGQTGLKGGNQPWSGCWWEEVGVGLKVQPADLLHSLHSRERRNQFFTETLPRVFPMLNPQLDLSGSCLQSPTNLGPTRPMWRCLSSDAVFRSPTNQMRMRFLILDSRSQGQSKWQRMQDCLLLNLYVPTGIEVPESGLPVMVWLHGGAFLFGQGWNCKHLFEMREFSS